MKNIRLVYISLFMSGLLITCVEPYNPPEIENAESLIVIDAQIDGEEGIGAVSLRKTVPLDASLDTVFDIRAVVSVEDESQNQYYFDRRGPGEYTIEGLDLNYGDKLRLNVVTNDDQFYQSEFVEFKETPEIDSLSWEEENGGVQFYVTTHDPNNSTTYYKWEYEETWEFNSAYQSSHYYIVEDSSLHIREDPSELYICYKYDQSNNIILGTSERYSEDVISEEPVVFIPGNSGKFDRKYSLLVKQQALSQEAYDYWLLLKKNTEDLGGFFDPQPSQIPGNIQNIDNSNEEVLGYFFINSFTEKRIFVDDNEVSSYDYRDPYAGCRDRLDTLTREELLDGDKLIVTEFTLMGPTPFYLVNFSSCVDCRYRGSNVTPPYWIE